MRSNGFYLMHRGWLDNPVLNGAREPYCRRAAWAWMVEEARWRDGPETVGGKRILLRRGQFSHSLRYMAKAWKWDEARVRRFFDALSTNKMIDAHTDAGQTVITICKYDEYQTNADSTDAGNDAEATQPRRSGDAEKKEGELREQGNQEEEGSLRSPSARATPEHSPSLFPDGQAVRKAKKRTEYSAAFEAFWKNYPRKENKCGAERAFAGALKHADAATIIAKLRDYPFDRSQPRYIPHAATWLNGRRWQDELADDGPARPHNHQHQAPGRDPRGQLGYVHDMARRYTSPDQDHGGPVIEGEAE